MSRRTKEETKSRVLQSAAKLFLNNGYSKTKIADISEDSKIPYTEIFRVCIDKETILKELVELVIKCQFEYTNKILSNITSDKMFIYAFQAVLQLNIAESSEHLREMYVTSYSLHDSSEVIYKTITRKLEDVFKEHLPHYQTKDFFELEIATAGIMRGYLTVPCNMYFTMDRKISRFIETTFKLYDVDSNKIREITEFILKYDFKMMTNEIVNLMYNYFEQNISNTIKIS